MKEKLIRELRFEDVRRVCIENNLYTKGDNEDYTNLMFFVTELKNMTDYRLILIAKDILKHSDTDYSLATIVTLLNEKIFIDIEEA